MLKKFLHNVHMMGTNNISCIIVNSHNLKEVKARVSYMSVRAFQSILFWQKGAFVCARYLVDCFQVLKSLTYVLLSSYKNWVVHGQCVDRCETWTAEVYFGLNHSALYHVIELMVIFSPMAEFLVSTRNLNFCAFCKLIFFFFYVIAK